MVGDYEMEREIKKKAVIYGAAALLLTMVLAAMLLDFGYLPVESLAGEPPVPVVQTAFLSTFSSYDAMKTFITSNLGTQAYYPFYGRANLWALGADSARFFGQINFMDALAKAGAKSPTFEYSTTNIQVAGVDEADIVKTDGEYIYTLSGNVVVIVRAYPPADAEVVARIDFAGAHPTEIYIAENRLVVLGFQVPSQYSDYYVANFKTFANIYDLNDIVHPVLLRNLTMTGGYVSSRMIGHHMYVVVSQPTYMTNDTIILPTIYSNGQVKNITATEIHYSNTTENSYDFTTVFAVNVQNATEAPTYLTVLLGGTSNIFVSQTNMYLTFPEWNDNTSLIRVHLQGTNMTCEANGKVPGRELNQFSMDEYNDYFRIVTRSWINGTSQSCLYILDMNLTVVGRLEGLGLSENLHSSRFMGDRCYLVTFKKTDPLFVINLTDPANPTVLGELKIPGYSDYLHPYDATHIIGVGKETVEASQGDFAWYQGIKISLFDVSNVSNPIQVDEYVIGDRGTYSPVLDDHKAFLFDKEKNLLVIPALVYEIDKSQYPHGEPWVYGTPVWQGAYVFSITADGFELKGKITHGEDSGVPESSYWVMRALYIEDVLYTVSEKKIKLNSLDDLELLEEIPLS